MRACIQRVRSCRVRLPEEGNRISGEIGPGMLVLLGIGVHDTEEDAKWLARKIVNLRIFDDDQGKMNLDVVRSSGSILVVSQFTLYATIRHGNRPGFTEAARPGQAVPLYEFFLQELRNHKIPVSTGVFQTNMQVDLTNDGPVTVWVDTIGRTAHAAQTRDTKDT